MLNVFVREHSFVVQNVIDKDVVAEVGCVARVRFVVVVVLENFAALVNDPLVKVAQIIPLLLVLIISWRQFEDGIGINYRLIL